MGWEQQSHTQEALGDVMFFQAPKLGQLIKQGKPIAVIESVKAASDIHAPVSREIIAPNDEVDVSPELVNKKPYGIWLFKIKLTSNDSLGSDLNQLLTLEEYGAGPGA